MGKCRVEPAAGSPGDRLWGEGSVGCQRLLGRQLAVRRSLVDHLGKHLRDLLAQFLGRHTGLVSELLHLVIAESLLDLISAHRLIGPLPEP